MLEENNSPQEPSEPYNEYPVDHQDTYAALHHSIAEESEEISLKEVEQVPTQDYHNLSLEEIVASLEHLVNNYKTATIKEDVETIRKVFYDKYKDAIEQKKETFLLENPDPLEEDMVIELPIKSTFDKVIALYRKNRAEQYKAAQQSLHKNLLERQSIIEELKNIIDQPENLGVAFKKIAQIRERWRQAGPIPKDNYNIIWNDYHFHLERFYDQIDLDREARDMEFKLNLEQKQSLIAKAKELLLQPDIQRSVSQLRTLHRIWKEEIGPVDHKYREEIWNEFNEVSKKIFDKLHLKNKELRAQEEKNAEIKATIIASINHLNNQTYETVKQWRSVSNEVDALREQFFKVGRVPADQSDQIWEQFKVVTKSFQSAKRAFYNELRKEQLVNYNQKLALVEKAQALMHSDDFETTTPIMIQIQEDWRKIGQVPQKYSNTIWTNFREACNYYFNRMHDIRNKKSSAEVQNLDQKKSILNHLHDLKLTGDYTKDFEMIKEQIDLWDNLGPVPGNRRQIESKFDRAVESLFHQLNLNTKTEDLESFNSRIHAILATEDYRLLKNEQFFIQKQIEGLQADLIQLENNIQFFTSSSKENPLIDEINNNIIQRKEELLLWKEKLDSLQTIANNN